MSKNNLEEQLKENLPQGEIFQFIFRLLEKKYAKLFFAFLFLGEIFLLIPLDLVLGIFVTKHKNEYVKLSLIAAICSALSAGIGYFIGYHGFDRLQNIIFKIISKSAFVKVTSVYKIFEIPVIFLASIVPFPFKLIAVSAGVCKISFLKFFITIFIARLIRFLLISLITIHFGARIFRVFEKYSYPLIIGFGILLILACLWVMS